MANQSPTIFIPKKSTEEVDWTTPIRHLIAQSYGENPDNYAQECAALQRARQDAVRGAGSDMTARDLLYKYFGQLELLELRFAEIRVNFPWHDAFTNKLTTQTSLAFEKASIIFQIAATHSAIASSQNRGDPEGLKRAFHYFRTSAGMLTYINDNFLHAPSTDLSREVVKFLVNIMLAQASEVFFEKCVDENKAKSLVAKIANQVASLYVSLCEEVKEFMGKGIFDRNWVTIIQIKSKYFTSLAQLYRSYVDSSTAKYGDALARLTSAETSAKEASKLASSFGGMFMTQMSPNLPPDAGSAIQEIAKFHLALCTETRTQAQKDNDLIYNAIVPPVETLPAIDKLVVATPIPIQEVYSAPEVQRTIGPDLFIKLIPLSVHESASVYSEEKAKLVRAEVERADSAESEVRSSLDAMGVKDGLLRFKAIVEQSAAGRNLELPQDILRIQIDLRLIESREPVSALFVSLDAIRSSVHQVLESAQRDLEIESRDCEAARVRYSHEFGQEPSASVSRSLRSDLKSHREAMEKALVSDKMVTEIWDSVKGDITILVDEDGAENTFRSIVNEGLDGNKIEFEVKRESLLDLDLDKNDEKVAKEEEERGKIVVFIDEIEQRLGRLNKISVERKNVLKDLKEKIQSDDVSHLLLLNRRHQSSQQTPNSSQSGSQNQMEALFATELEKFKPYQQRLAASVAYEQAALAEITQLYKGLKNMISSPSSVGSQLWRISEKREKRLKDTIRRFTKARDGYMEARDGLAKGLQFYRELNEMCDVLRENVKAFVEDREKERQRLVREAERKERERVVTSTVYGSASPSLPEKPKPLVPPPPPPPLVGNLNAGFSAMNLSSRIQSPPFPTEKNQQSSLQQSNYSGGSFSSSGSLPPPPPPRPNQADPYAGMFDSNRLSSQFSIPLASGPPQIPPSSSPLQYPVQQYRQQYPTSTQVPQQSSQPPLVSNGYNSFGSLLPPPPPISYQTHQQQFGNNASPQGSHTSSTSIRNSSFPDQQPSYSQGQFNNFNR